MLFYSSLVQQCCVRLASCKSHHIRNLAVHLFCIYLSVCRALEPAAVFLSCRSAWFTVFCRTGSFGACFRVSIQLRKQNLSFRKVSASLTFSKRSPCPLVLCTGGQQSAQNDLVNCVPSSLDQSVHFPSLGEFGVPGEKGERNTCALTSPDKHCLALSQLC